MERPAQIIILLVEDDLQVSNMLKQFLSVPLPDRSSAEILVCANLDCAIEKYEEHKDSIRLVITDNSYPGGNDGGGAELIRHIREKNKYTPIIVLTGLPVEFHDNNPDLHEIIVGKPCVMNAFLSVVRYELGFRPSNEVKHTPPPHPEP